MSAALSQRVAALRPATDLVQRELQRQVAAGLFDEAPAPLAIGRYTVLAREGAGGMGTVFAAWDHRLQRRVALKVLHRTHGRDAQDRILDEARALARLAHPHVVGVYDVGRDGDEAFIAMEFVAGDALGLHVRRVSATAERLATWLAEAASGLAAAHAAGLVHGDVKPGNLVVGDDDRVRVIDFGLATAQGAMRAKGGTRGYLAPELVRGEPPSAASDVLALVVTADELREAIGPGRWPRRLRRVLARGRHDDPERRCTMTELLVALRASARAPWERRVVAVTLTLGLGVLALDSAPPPKCELPIDARWHAGLRDDAERVLAQRGEEGEALWASIAAPLDRHASAWVMARDAACALPESTRAPVVACLDDHVVALEAVATQLERLPRADQVLAAIEDPARCVSETLELGTDDVEHRHALARVQVAEALGDYPEALRLALELDAAARRTGDPIARAQAELELGDLQALAGDPRGAVPRLHDAYFRAAAHGDGHLAIRAMLSIMQITADSIGDPAAAERWQPALLAAIARDEPPIATRVRALEAMARLAEHAADWTTMRAMTDELLRHDEGQLRDDPVARYRARLLYAGVLRQLGDPVGQVSQLLAAASIVEGVHPAGHPDIGLTYIALGSAWDDLGELERAEAALERGITMLERAEIVDRLGDPHYLLGRVYAAQGRVDDARREFETSARLLAQYRGAAHPDAILPLVGLGELATSTGDLVAAREHYERALQIAVRPTDRGYLHFGLGLVAATAEEWDRAIALQEQARALLGDEDAERVLHSETWFAQAQALRGRGDEADARAAFLRARELAEREPQLLEVLAAVDRELE